MTRRRRYLATAAVLAAVVCGGWVRVGGGGQPPDPPTPATPPDKPEATPATPAPATPAPASQPPDAPPAPPAAVPAEEPPEVVVYFKEGQSITGLLVEATATRVVLRIAGIEAKFPASTIDRYRVLAPVLERYEAMRRAVGEDAEQIVKLAEWLRDRERYELALDEAERALTINPNNSEARQLSVVLTKQIELKKKARTPQPPAPKPGQPQPAPIPKQRDFPLLSDAQVNLIKVYEVNLSQPPRLVIKRETISRLIERFGASPLIPVTQEAREAIYRKPERDVLELMFRLQARDLYGEVKVVDQPESMRLFRDDVHATWLVNSCATTTCHGGEDAGRLMLAARKPRAEATVYTNFLILDRFRLADGTPLINYENPERSPLLQMALPREDSVFKHPVVGQVAPGAKAERDAFRPVFRSTDDRRFKQAEDWVRAMYRPHPDYPVDYHPPGASVAAAAEPAGATKPEPAPR